MLRHCGIVCKVGVDDIGGACPPSLECKVLLAVPFVDQWLIHSKLVNVALQLRGQLVQS